MPEAIKEKKETKAAEFKGKFIAAIGRRKTSSARVRVYKKGSGIILVNDQKISEYLPAEIANIAKQPLRLAGLAKDLDISAIVRGGGKKSQAEAIRHGISRILVGMDEALKPGLKAKGWLTRDARKKERKKPGLKKARRAPQWSKR